MVRRILSIWGPEKPAGRYISRFSPFSHRAVGLIEFSHSDVSPKVEEWTRVSENHSLFFR